MRIGAAQIDITPPVGAELSGFAARVQPSSGVLDPLQARALCLSGERARLLWIHCDLIGFTDEFVREFVTRTGARLGLAPHEILLSATHTHSGPCTLRLEEAGRFDLGYLETLGLRLEEVAKRALATVEPCHVVMSGEELELAVDRRHGGRPRSGLRVSAAGFVRDDGTFAGVVANYPIHPVALGARNNRISADISGEVARVLSAELPGHPVVLATNGACGDLNPPAENVPFVQVQAWGRSLAAGVARCLRLSPEPVVDFDVARVDAALPLEVLSREQVEVFAARALGDEAALGKWDAKFRRVVEKWRRDQSEAMNRGTVARERLIALTAVRLNEMYLVAVNAEVFSAYTDQVRALTGCNVVTVGYANGNWGYLAPRRAYAKGGYEVERAHLFYGGFRFDIGGLEALAEKTAELVRRLSRPGEVRVPPGPCHP